VGLFPFLFSSFPLLAFPFIIIAKVGVLVIWCIVHHVPLHNIIDEFVLLLWTEILLLQLNRTTMLTCYTQIARSEFRSIMNDSD